MFFDVPETADKATSRHIYIGMAMIVASAFLIIVMNACAKYVSPYHDPVEIVFYRNFMALLMVTGFVVSTKRFHAFKTRRPWGHLGRATVGNIGLLFGFWAYALMPMADTTALLFTAGLMTTAFSGPVLGEKIGPYRWSAVIIGFAGTLLITQPNGDSFLQLGTLIALAAAFCNGWVAIFLRSLGKTESAFTTVFYFVGIGTLVPGVYMIFNGSLPHPDALWPILGTGMAGGLSLLIKTQAYRLVEASLLSPFLYTQIVWATLFGFVFWGDLPTLPVVAGAFIIIASNLFILWREQRKK